MDSMEKFGKYVLVKLIATGGMAEVFLAKEFGISGFQRILAIKRVLPHLAQDHEFIEMFTGEARLSAQLSHPNIVQIYEFGIIEGSYYLAMEYIDGTTLSDLLSRYAWKQEVLPLELSLLILSELCQGLEYAHNKRSLNNEPLNIVHRDISPKNAMLSYDGAVKLMDFGIAKAADQQRQETISGTIKGKISYLSPEQVMGQKLDRRSDLFSLGVVFWEMLTSQRCFSGDNEFAILYKIRMGEVAPPSSLNPAIPKELDAIVLKVLKQEREERYQNAEELLNDINQFRYKHGMLASTSKLAAFLRDLKSADEEDTLSALQKIDWKQVEAEFGVGATGSLRSDLDTPVSETPASPETTGRTKTPGKGIKTPEAIPGAEKSRKIARPPGKETSKRIRRPEEVREGSSKIRSETKKARPQPVQEQEIEEDELGDAFDESPAPSKVVPVLLAFSIVLLVVSVATFFIVLWPRIMGPVPEPQPTQAATPKEATPVATASAPEVATPSLVEAAPPTPAVGVAPVPSPTVAATSQAPPPTPAGSSPSAMPGRPTPRPPEPTPEPVQPSPRAAATPAGPAVVIQTPQPQPPTPRVQAPSPSPAHAQPTPTTTVPPPKPKGSVLVTSVVPADLYLAGQSLGRATSSGLRLQLAPGAYQLVAISYIPSPPTFYRADLGFSFDGVENATYSVKFPELGSLNVTSALPATLFVDGVRIDQTPIQKFNVTAGMHELRFEFKNGAVSKLRYQVRAGQYATVFGKP
jgi:eukaryotic-like serine/threonine-protein kinase